MPGCGRTRKMFFYLSTNGDPTTANTVRRRRKDGTLKDVPCPSVATAYNKFMFGVGQTKLECSILLAGKP